MSLIIVDPAKCRRDGICVAECPMGILAQPERDQPPVAVAGAEDICINCGHCLAVCPHGALELKAMARQDTAALDPADLPSADQVDLALRSRRSIRSYRDEPLPRAQLAELIDVARYAPSGHNRQPLSWLVVSDRDELARLGGIVVDWMGWVCREDSALAELLHLRRAIQRWEDGTDVVLRGAPHLALVHAPQGERTAPAAGVLAMAYLDLAAAGRGLGACWAGYVMTTVNLWPPMAEALALPEGHGCFGAMMLGRPRYGFQRIPARKQPPITWR